MKREAVRFHILRTLLWIGTACLFLSALPAHPQERRTKIRISNATLSFTALPLLAARDWKLFDENGLEGEIIVMASSVAAAALHAGDIDYVSGVGPASVSATLSGLPSRAVWFSSSRLAYWLMAHPRFRTVQELKGKKIGVTGLGGTTHISLIMALEKNGANPKDFVVVSVPSIQILQSLESGFVDAAALPPPPMFFAQRRGFHKLLDIGAVVEMPAGGLTTLVKTIKGRPDEVKRVIRALQIAKRAIRKSKDRTVDLVLRTLKIDRETASETYDLYVMTLSESGVPSRVGMENLIKSVKSQGRFADRKIDFEDVADDSLARDVARELGYKTE